MINRNINNKEMEKLLAIYIPTYHRADSLLRTIKSVVDNVNFKEIELYISNDDASDTDTEYIGKKMAAQYNNISFFSNEKNLGSDGNMFLASRIKKTKYVLLLGDDDTLEQGVLQYLCEKLVCIEKSGGSDFLVLNSKTMDGDKELYSNPLKIVEDVTYKTTEQAYLKLFDKLTFGTIIWNMNSFQNLCKKDYEKYLGTLHLYAGICWEMALHSFRKNKIYLISRICICRHEEEEKSWKASEAYLYYVAMPKMKKVFPFFNHNPYRKDILHIFNKNYSFKNQCRILQEMSFRVFFEKNYDKELTSVQRTIAFFVLLLPKKVRRIRANYSPVEWTKHLVKTRRI